MYCILVTGIPASGKSTMAKYISEKMNIPMLSKDSIKEILFDEVGFQSREGKVKLGNASMKMMYYSAEQLMKTKQTFVLENNFENTSKEGLSALLEKYSYTAITVRLTGDYEKIYQRFLERNDSSDRHRGHVVNDCYPEKETGIPNKTTFLSFEGYLYGIEHRGFDSFSANGPCITVDTTDFSKVDADMVIDKISRYIK